MLVFLAALGGLLALLVHDVLPPFPFAVFALSTGALLQAIPLLSELGTLLRRDEAEEWVASLPTTSLERTLARVLLLLSVLLALDLAFWIPFALLAPAELGLLGRLGLPLLGFGLTLTLATVAIWTQVLLTRTRRAQAWLVAFQTLVVGAVITGLLQSLGHLPELARLTPGDSGLIWLPPGWFAAPLVGAPPQGWAPAVLGVLLSVASLPFLPGGPAPRSEPRARGLLERWLAPLRALAWRAWVRPAERGSFDLVYDGLSREREFTLRTLPLLGIPLAFLWLAARRGAGGWESDFLATLFFTVGVLQPLLLSQVPLTESPGARWILGLAPQDRPALEGGAMKALFVRWILPLHLCLAVLALIAGQGKLVLRLWPLSVLASLLLLRFLYPRCVHGLPLSTAPEELRGDTDWAGSMIPLALGATLLAVAANRLLPWPLGLGLALGLLAVEFGLEFARSRAGR